MARELPLLDSQAPTFSAINYLHVGHVQLRDIVCCPNERGVVNYLANRVIVEHNITRPDLPPRNITSLSFRANCLSSLRLPDSDSTIFAAGGQKSELHLSIHTSGHETSRFETNLGCSINNSVLLTTLNLTGSPEGAVEPRIVISNNNQTVKLYDVAVRVLNGTPISPCGQLHLPYFVNHSSISPDGRTLLTIGDSNEVNLHRMSGGSRVTFSPISTLTIPPSLDLPSKYRPNALTASFSSAFSADGSKFVVASQEGVVAVWDVRSTRPLKVFHTDKTRVPKGTHRGEFNERLSDDPLEWTFDRSKAPGWSARCVKFGGGGNEIMAFTEHRDLVHVVDARTFETEEIIRVPSYPSLASPKARMDLYSRRSTPGSSQSHTPPYTHDSSLRSPQTSPGPHRLSFTSSPYPSPPGPSFVTRTRRPNVRSTPVPRVRQALQDGFRVALSPDNPTPFSPPRSPRSPRSAVRSIRQALRAWDSERDDVVIIPTLGDSEIDNPVRNFLRYSTQDRADEFEHYMQVDEEDCASSDDGNEPPASGERAADEYDSRDSYHDRSHVVYAPVTYGEEGHVYDENLTLLDEHSDLTLMGEEIEDDDDNVDITGICFDPSGKHMYVASMHGVGEWSVRGADKHWWGDGAFT
ncbi:uncharacterized protein SCHCODRAFT_02610813 [Schizophyllum commune H4-8]|uniref:uncharacterized protein n=1 Tax=Schizophyllum commune (strain H4-8 / FGSC 9210) TaxID=578458 RepID=UPI00215F341D|nr:uncharacterized protein SCHCODRAFT_02610813 [Schizophyllum commune H4-8]KAI5897993.1 hypothetical protein SCHCODRAFT_02610813 [Schizophyllum commune H4-8]